MLVIGTALSKASAATAGGGVTGDDFAVLFSAHAPRVYPLKPGGVARPPSGATSKAGERRGGVP